MPHANRLRGLRDKKKRVKAQVRDMKNDPQTLKNKAVAGAKKLRNQKVNTDRTTPRRNTLKPRRRDFMNRTRRKVMRSDDGLMFRR